MISVTGRITAAIMPSGINITYNYVISVQTQHKSVSAVKACNVAISICVLSKCNINCCM